LVSRLIVPAALYALPVLVLEWIFGPRWALAPLVVCVLVLVYAAVRIWSPLVTLALVLVAGVSVVIWWVISTAGEACGDSRTATIVEWSGIAVVGLALPAWRFSHRGAIFWTIPAGAVLGGIWFVAAAHVIPGGAGACFH
jgi:hypothetical protein